MGDLFTNGFLLADVGLTHQQCQYLADAIPAVAHGHGRIRGLMQHPAVAQLLLHQRLGGYLWSVAGRDLVAVNATLFEKTSELAWRVGWHQDRVIAVRERMQVVGYGPWFVKAGVPYAEAPTAVLEQMLALRIYLDDTDSESSALHVISGSHRSGKLPDEELSDLVAKSHAIEIDVAKGGILLTRPLLIHASSMAHSPERRRVLLIELAPAEAISPLQWHSMTPLRRVA